MKETKRTVQILRIIMPIVGLICIVAFSPWDGIGAWITPLPDSVQEQVDDAIGHGLDGIIVYVDEAGQPPAFYTAGWKDRDNQIPADPQSLFKIASISKLYVAVATTKLVNHQRLSLDDTLADHFPELVGRIENAETITLRLMVQHRSGIPNYTDDPDFLWDDPPKNKKESLELVLDMPADFEPDKKYRYSNTNYLLISELIEKITGMSKFEYIREEILTPLGLKNTFGSINEVNADDVMSGYYVGVEEDLKTDNSGLMIATAEDVGIFLRALNDGSVFNEGEQEIYSSIYVYEHTGLLVGYQSIAKYHKDIDTVIIQFNNTTNFNGYDWNLAEIIYSRIVKIVRKRKISANV